MLGIYIHIPFCKQKCKYCDFNSYPSIADMSSLYANALVKEIEFFKQKISENRECLTRKVDTVYIGGGTPTYIDQSYIKIITEKLSETFDIENDAEITIECNPGTVDFDKLRDLKACGINRISIGCQSTDDDILKRLGRIHTYRDFEDCFNLARRAGFDNISVDLMFGLPGQTMDIWLDTMNKITDLSPEHISAYSLKIEPNTPFFDMYENGILSVPNDDENRNMYDKAVEFLGSKGYNRYEISNFSKPDCMSKHNLKYWDCDEYIGFGCGAYSYCCSKRFSNIYNIHDYIASINTENSAMDKESNITLTKDDKMSEFVFLGLRLDTGISIKEFQKRFEADIYRVFEKPLQKHLSISNTLVCDGEYIKIKPEFTYVSNIIMSDFLL